MGRSLVSNPIQEETEMEKVKKGKRAVVCFQKSGERQEKNVPVSRALIIAKEYKAKTGKTVTIKLS